MQRRVVLSTDTHLVVAHFSMHCILAVFRSLAQDCPLFVDLGGQLTSRYVITFSVAVFLRGPLHLSALS